MQRKNRKKMQVIGSSLLGATVSFGLLANAGAHDTGNGMVAASSKGPATTKVVVKNAAAIDPAVPLTDDEMIVHVLNRLGYGPRPGDFERVKAMGLDAYVQAQLNPETVNDSALDRKLVAWPMLSMTSAQFGTIYQERTEAQKVERKERKELLTKETAAKAAAATSGAPAAGQPGSAVMVTPGMDATMAPAGAAAAPGAAGKQELLLKATPAERQKIQQDRRELQEKSQPINEAQREFAESKALRAIESERQLNEVLVDFWTNHFNIDMRKGACGVLKISDDRDVIRAHAFGKFRDLLEASAKSPAMLVYLDNFQSTAPQAAPAAPAARRRNARRRQANAAGAGTVATAAIIPPKKGKQPGGLNENYGREIMELHTLGVDGGYTQKDVTEVARCFTGWSIGRPGKAGAPARGKYAVGEFQFYPRLHDEGEKVVLGQVIPANGGIADGEKVLDILASSPATMRHISYELCERFVSDTPPPTLVDKCVATWQKTDGNIREIMRTIVTSPEFFSRASYMRKIKSPFEYAVSSVRALGGNYRDLATVDQMAKRRGGKNNNKNGIAPELGDQSIIGQVNTMGEPLFQYQAPTGYPENSHKWVSSGALISRLNYSLALTGGRLSELQLPDLDEVVTGATSPAQVVDRLAVQILHGGISSSTRASLLREASAPPTATNISLRPASAVASDTAQTNRLAALMLGAPEFQRR